MLKRFQQGDCHFPHLRMGGGAGTELEEMPPFPEVHRDDDLGLEAVGKDRPCFLRGRPQPDQLHIILFNPFHGVCPYAHLDRVVLPVERADKGQFVAELVVGIITISG